MRVVIDLEQDRHEVELRRYGATATLADLVAHTTGVTLDPEAPLHVDQTGHAAGTPLREVQLLEGTVIARQARTEVVPVADWTATLSGGLHAGQVLHVPTRRPLVLGRSPQADLHVDSASVSWNHLTVTREGDGLRVRDSGSTNGTRLTSPDLGTVAVDDADGVLVADEAIVVAGGASIWLRRSLDEQPAPRPGSLHNVTPTGTVPFNRPPRPGTPPPPEPAIPPQPQEVAQASRFSIVMVIAPLVLAAAMMAMMKDPRYAMFALLSPVMAVGSWFEQKHRRGKDLKAEDERFSQAVTDFGQELESAAASEAQRRLREIPDPATALRRAQLPTTQLWQRRFGSPDFLALHAGIGDVPWEAPVENRSSTRLHEKVRAVAQASRLRSAPVDVDLSEAGVVGIVGEREGALAVARSLLAQAVVHVGPADLTVALFCDPGREAAWEWASWLPHTRRLGVTSGDRWISANRARSNELLRELRDGLGSHPTLGVLMVIDSDVLTEGRDAPARALLGQGRHSNAHITGRPPEVQVSGIVIAATEEQLPASCTVVVRVQDDAYGTVTRPGDLKTVDDVVLAGIDVETARAAALDLSRFDDPELTVPGAALPNLVRLPPLLDIEPPTAADITELWTTSRGVSTPIGVGESGSYSLDLVKDGPHGLVGGTTGSGKSEFLRTLVAGLAARNAPTKLTFILIDFKGGAAFATCERLPHTIGTVSNLDEQLADRALRALEAEMEYRQRLFAAAGEGVDNLDAYLATNPAEPLPRLLLVVDEFAMLAKDYPDVLSSLVRVAAVGRTLGVHMILATQRPAGVVNDDILANTNLRVALRVQSRDDSTNVIGVGDASAIANSQKGRAFVKLGQDDITPVQTALVTGAAEQEDVTAVEVEELQLGVPVPGRRPAKKKVEAVSDLDLLIDAIAEANREAGFAPPRPVWPEPLDERVDLAGFQTPDEQRTEGGAPVPVVGGVRGDRVVFALADDPDHQRQVEAGWDLGRGNLLLMGIPGYGTSTALASVTLALAAELPPQELDVLVLDMGSRDLAVLEGLPHTTAYVSTGANSREQQMRYLRHVRGELERRRTEPGPHPKALFVIDGLAALKDEMQDFEGLALLDGLYRAYTDGPDVGMHFAVSTTRSKAVPPAIDEVTTQKWLFRLADPYDYSTAGIKPAQGPSPVPGRCVLAETRLQTHVATPWQGFGQAVAEVSRRWRDAAPKESAVGQLPEDVRFAELGVQADVSGEPWLVPVGVRESDLAPHFLELYEGEHLLIAGPARSGRSTLLLAIAEALRSSAASQSRPVRVWGLCDRRSPLATADLERVAVGADEVAALVAQVRLQTDPVALLVDDAERFEDGDGALEGLLSLPHVHLIASGRSDDLRSLYSHWTKTLRKARCGVLLRPNIDYDGDLLGVNLPRHAPVVVGQGRGYACMLGSAVLVQSMSPSRR